MKVFAFLLAGAAAESHWNDCQVHAKGVGEHVAFDETCINSGGKGCIADFESGVFKGCRFCEFAGFMDVPCATKQLGKDLQMADLEDLQSCKDKAMPETKVTFDPKCIFNNGGLGCMEDLDKFTGCRHCEYGEYASIPCVTTALGTLDQFEQQQLSQNPALGNTPLNNDFVQQHLSEHGVDDPHLAQYWRKSATPLMTQYARKSAPFLGQYLRRSGSKPFLSQYLRKSATSTPFRQQYLRRSGFVAPKYMRRYSSIASPVKYVRRTSPVKYVRRKALEINTPQYIRRSATPLLSKYMRRSAIPFSKYIRRSATPITLAQYAQFKTMPAQYIRRFTAPVLSKYLRRSVIPFSKYIRRSVTPITLAQFKTMPAQYIRRSVAAPLLSKYMRRSAIPFSKYIRRSATPINLAQFAQFKTMPAQYIRRSVTAPVLSKYLRRSVLPFSKYIRRSVTPINLAQFAQFKTMPAQYIRRSVTAPVLSKYMRRSVIPFSKYNLPITQFKTMPAQYIRRSATVTAPLLSKYTAVQNQDMTKAFIQHKALHNQGLIKYATPFIQPTSIIQPTIPSKYTRFSATAPLLGHRQLTQDWMQYNTMPNKYTRRSASTPQFDQFGQPAAISQLKEHTATTQDTMLNLMRTSTAGTIAKYEQPNPYLLKAAIEYLK